MKLVHGFFSFALRVPHADCIVEYPSCFEDRNGVGKSGTIRDRIGGLCLELNFTHVSEQSFNWKVNIEWFG